ncbi:MAG: hypothetical protein ACRCTU_15020 [Zoogloea sp.]|uniref:hypothetical protein n=1 Tax=Zoogloea sp. TaxID=49181 RepID=UPI003F363C06
MSAGGRKSAVCLGLALSGCGYTQLHESEESLQAASSELVQHYTQRAQLLPPLIQALPPALAQGPLASPIARIRQIQTHPIPRPEQVPLPVALTEEQAQVSAALDTLLAGLADQPRPAALRDAEAQLEVVEQQLDAAEERYQSALAEHDELLTSWPHRLIARLLGRP